MPTPFDTYYKKSFNETLTSKSFSHLIAAKVKLNKSVDKKKQVDKWTRDSCGRWRRSDGHFNKTVPLSKEKKKEYMTARERYLTELFKIKTLTIKK